MATTLSDRMDYQNKKDVLVNELKSKVQEGGGQVALYKTSSNLFRSVSRSNKANKIDVRAFNNVIRIDKENRIAEVEGMTTYDALVKETLKHRLLPAVVPQLKTITIGGAYAGGGIESSSFRYGLVHETITEAEILLGNGSVYPCSLDGEHSDLFYAFPNTYGTLGYALKVNVKLVPAKRFVHLNYLRFSNSEELIAELERLCRGNRGGGDVDFIDAVIFSSTEMYIITGTFCDEAPYFSDYTYMKIYYQAIREKKDDYLTTYDYIWRWDADWFWCSKVFFMQNCLARALFGKFMLKSQVYSKIMHYLDKPSLLSTCVKSLRKRQEAVIQDILIPSGNAQKFIDFFQNHIGITPIWVCPTQAYSQDAHYPFCPLDPNTLYLDFGFWDSVQSDKPAGYYNRSLEKIATDLEGFKSLYSSSFYTEDEFWQMYDRELYSTLKRKYDPQHRLKDLYTKCCAH